MKDRTTNPPRPGNQLPTRPIVSGTMVQTTFSRSIRASAANDIVGNSRPRPMRQHDATPQMHCGRLSLQRGGTQQ